MNELANKQAMQLPAPRVDIAIRDATMADVPFIDQLQKLHSNQVGFMRTSWIEAKIAKGEVIIAESVVSGQLSVASEEKTAGSLHLLTTGNSQLATPLGYCMGVDRYFKRDDVGIIHQMNVVPGRQRSFIGATLLKAMFERSAYGCRLFCCWCAQDLAANRFWESMGFVPLAFRAGSEKKGRVHIFWQKRIRAGDTQTPWWFPAKTDGGVMRADRIVLPIPPGLRWSDEMPAIIRPMDEQTTDVKRQLPAKTSKARLPLSAPTKHGPRQFGSPPAKPVAAPIVEKPKREKTPKPKVDPKWVAAARELRDRWLERVNTGEAELGPEGKYDVVRSLAAPMSGGRPIALLTQAAWNACAR
ncbi:MAG: GNAT family N-acetyltransferase [Chthoniobacterales bacterium]|nr:GNAT family N-acetyltransferase [Chthoniobacterales bacterium]